MIGPRLNQTVLPDESECLKAWLTQSCGLGTKGKAAIFTTSFRDADAYMRAGDQIIPPTTNRQKASFPDVEWTRMTGQSLILDSIPSIYQAHRYAGRDFSFLAIHEPSGWLDQARLDYMLGLLKPGGMLIAVRIEIKSSMVNPPDSKAAWPDSSDPEASAKIDYSRITRELAG